MLEGLEKDEVQVNLDRSDVQYARKRHLHKDGESEARKLEEA